MTVCVLYFHVCVCTEICVLHSYVYLSTWSQRAPSDAFFSHPLPYLLSLELSSFSRAASQQAPGISCLHLPTAGVLGTELHTWLLHGCWGSERRSHVHTVSSLPGELLPQPPAAYYSSQQSWFTWFSLSTLLYQITPQTRCFKQFISNTGRWESWFDVCHHSCQMTRFPMSHTESLGLCFRVLISCLKVPPPWSSHLSKVPPLSHHGNGEKWGNFSPYPLWIWLSLYCKLWLSWDLNSPPKFVL